MNPLRLPLYPTGMSTTVESPILVESFLSDRLSICANVRALPDSEEHELLVVDVLTGDVVITRVLPTKELAVVAAKDLTTMSN